MFSWLYRKTFGETTAQRQERKLGKINTIRADLHNNEDTPILDGHYVIPTVMGFIEPPPKRKNKKKKRKK